MYKIEWDKETGGIVLKSYVTPETLGYHHVLCFGKNWIC